CTKARTSRYMRLANMSPTWRQFVTARYGYVECRRRPPRNGYMNVKPNMAALKKDQPDATGAAGQARDPAPWSLTEHAPALLASAAEQIGDALQALQSGIDQLDAESRLGPRHQWTLGVPMARIKRLSIVMQQLQRF